MVHDSNRTLDGSFLIASSDCIWYPIGGYAGACPDRITARSIILPSYRRYGREEPQVLCDFSFLVSHTFSLSIWFMFVRNLSIIALARRSEAIYERVHSSRHITENSLRHRHVSQSVPWFRPIYVLKKMGRVSSFIL